jgi:hypothetical protein
MTDGNNSLISSNLLTLSPINFRLKSKGFAKIRDGGKKGFKRRDSEAAINKGGFMQFTALSKPGLYRLSSAARYRWQAFLSGIP